MSINNMKHNCIHISYPCKSGQILIHLGPDIMTIILDDVFQCSALNENVSIKTDTSSKYVPKGPI